MKISETLLPEFDQEMATTRRLLERVPEDKLGWKPHEKSMTLGRLAGHVAEIPNYGVATMNMDSLDVNPIGGRPYEPLMATSRAQLLAAFDRNVVAGRAAIAAGSDGAMAETWSLLAAGNPIFEMPRVAVLRVLVMNHLIHHRGQLSVYLRQTGALVPSIYGPSADEGQMGASAA
jgi:uncharacterized damage-inducible protein DinB